MSEEHTPDGFSFNHVVIDADGIYLDGIKIDGRRVAPGIKVTRNPNAMSPTVTLTVSAAQVFVTDAAKQLDQGNITEVHGG